MDTIDVICNGRQLCIEICETWDFVRDAHSCQAHVVDKEAMQRYVIGKYDSSEIAEQEAREWINNQ